MLLRRGALFLLASSAFAAPHAYADPSADTPRVTDWLAQSGLDEELLDGAAAAVPIEGAVAAAVSADGTPATAREWLVRSAEADADAGIADGVEEVWEASREVPTDFLW
jgi:hypothetical protein